MYTVKEYNPKNRSLLAATAIKEGTTIMEVQPLCWAVLSVARSKFCSFCLEQQPELMRCGACATLFYCSKDCQKADWKLHKQECKVYSQLTKEKKFKVTAEFVLLARCYLQLREDKGFSEKVLEMLDVQDFLPEEKSEHFRSMAVCLVENFGLEKSAEMLALLFKLASIISVNAFTIQDYLFNYEGIAIGLYHPANFINHSCRPNAVQLFDGKTLRIIALQDIAQDEEVFISYLDELNDQPTRNKMLRETYLFDCGCFHCLAEKAVKTSGYGIICPGCGNEGLKQSAADKTYQCSECSQQFPEAHIQQLKTRIVSLRATLLEASQKYQAQLKPFFQLKKLTRFSEGWYSKILQNLYLGALTEGNACQDLEAQRKHFEASYKLLKAYLQNFKGWYGMDKEQEFHPLLLWKYSEAGKLAMFLNKPKKALQYTEKAIEILKKCRLSDSHQEVKDLKRRHQQLTIECRMHATAQLK